MQSSYFLLVSGDGCRNGKNVCVSYQVYLLPLARSKHKTVSGHKYNDGVTVVSSRAKSNLNLAAIKSRKNLAFSLC